MQWTFINEYRQPTQQTPPIATSTVNTTPDKGNKRTRQSIETESGENHPHGTLSLVHDHNEILRGQLTETSMDRGCLSQQTNTRTDDTILQSFDQLFTPFYELLLNDMNTRRELRIFERNQPKLTKQRGRPSQSRTTNMCYNSSFVEPFSLNDLKAFLACFYRITVLGDHNMDVYWQTTADSNSHGEWFYARMSRRRYEEMFRCLYLNIEQWVQLLNDVFSQAKNRTTSSNNGKHKPHVIFIPRKSYPKVVLKVLISDEDLFVFEIHMDRAIDVDTQRPLKRTKRERTSNINSELMEIVNFDSDNISESEDETIRSILACYYRHRIVDDKVAVLIFFLTLVAHNCRVLYNKGNSAPVSQVDFLTELSNQLCPGKDSYQRHELATLNKRATCAVCYWKDRKAGLMRPTIKRKFTQTVCVRCQKSMCVQCFESASHLEYAKDVIKKL